MATDLRAVYRRLAADRWALADELPTCGVPLMTQREAAIRATERRLERSLLMRWAAAAAGRSQRPYMKDVTEPIKRVVMGPIYSEGLILRLVEFPDGTGQFQLWTGEHWRPGGRGFKDYAPWSSRTATPDDLARVRVRISSSAPALSGNSKKRLHFVSAKCPGPPARL